MQKEFLEQCLAGDSAPDRAEPGVDPPLDGEVRIGDGAIIEASRIEGRLSQRLKDGHLELPESWVDYFRRKG
jgi:hypothetical protein